MVTGKQKERELIISLHRKKKTTRDIAFELDISKSKAAFWIKRYKQTNSLEDRIKSGRPTKIQKDKLNDISNDIRQKIRQQANKKTGIRSKEVKQIIERETKQTYSIRHVRRIMRNIIGLTLTTPRPQHVRTDKQKQEEFKQEFKKNSRQNMWVIQ